MKNPTAIEHTQATDVPPFPWLWVVLGAGMGTLLLCFPVWMNPTAHLGSAPFGDHGTNLWNLWWVYYALFEMGQSPLDCGIVFYPWGCDVRFHTLSLFNGVLAAPVTALAGSVVAYNLLFLLHSWATIVFASRWAYTYGLSAWAASWVGIITAFGPYRFAHLDHVNLFSTSTLFAAFWLCDQSFRQPTRTWSAGFAVAWVCTALIDWYYGLFVALYLSIHGLMWCWERRRRLAEWKHLLRFALPVGCMGLTVLAYFSRGEVAGRPPIDPEPMPMRISAFWSNDILQLIFPTWVLQAADFRMIIYGAEFMLHPGFLVLVTAVLGIVYARSLRLERGILGVAAGFFVLSMGPALLVGGWLVQSELVPFVALPAALYTVIPVLDSMRVFTRFAYPGYCILLLFSAGMLAHWFASAGRFRAMLWGMCVVIVLLETGFHFPQMVRYEVPAELGEIHVGPVLGLPKQPSAFMGLHMYHQTIHQQPIVLAEFSRLGGYRDRYLEQWPQVESIAGLIQQTNTEAWPGGDFCMETEALGVGSVIMVENRGVGGAIILESPECDARVIRVPLGAGENAVPSPIQTWMQNAR